MLRALFQKISAWFCPKCGELNSGGTMCFKCGAPKPR